MASREPMNHKQNEQRNQKRLCRVAHEDHQRLAQQIPIDVSQAPLNVQYPDLVPVVFTAINRKLSDNRVFDLYGASGNLQRVSDLRLADFDIMYQWQMQHSIELILQLSAVESPKRVAQPRRIALLNFVETV